MGKYKREQQVFAAPDMPGQKEKTAAPAYPFKHRRSSFYLFLSIQLSIVATTQRFLSMNTSHSAMTAAKSRPPIRKTSKAIKLQSKKRQSKNLPRQPLHSSTGAAAFIYFLSIQLSIAANLNVHYQ